MNIILKEKSTSHAIFGFITKMKKNNYFRFSAKTFRRYLKLMGKTELSLTQLKHLC